MALACTRHAPQECPGATDSGGATWEGRREAYFKRDYEGSAGLRHPALHTRHSEATRDVVSLNDPVERFLAQMGRCNGRWDGGWLEMTQDAPDHRLLGDCGNDPERAAPAKGTCGHIQSKYAPQEPGPVPVRCSSLRLIHAHTPLAWCRDNRLSQRAVRRQTAGIAHKVDARKGTSAAGFSKSSNGDSLMPVVPSDHGREKV